jgi:hypothetical protein
VGPGKSDRPRIAGRLGKCYICRTADPKKMKNKVIVAICARCQKLRQKFRKSAFEDYCLARFHSQPLNGKSSIAILITQDAEGLRAEELRLTPEGKYIRIEI